MREILAASIAKRFLIRLEDRGEYVSSGDHVGTSIMLRCGFSAPWQWCELVSLLLGKPAQLMQLAGTQ